MKRDASNNDLQNENNFLKLKLMLEHGADFSKGMEGLDPNLENQFLKNIDEFERQFAARKKIRVFEKLDSPAHFLPVTAIPDAEMDNAWEQLHRYMQSFGIELDVCSPNVNSRELYRFATEELFEKEIDDTNISGMICGFIYDEYYPDHKYENTRVALENCMSCFFSKKGLEWLYDFKESGIMLNDHPRISLKELRKKVSDFQSAYQSIDVLDLREDGCDITEKECRVNGVYKIKVRLETEVLILEGAWEVQFEKEEERDAWYIIAVKIVGLDL
ncbi:hypothetical protein [Ferruginibacter sp. HRS2-29]|uniref:hypothetical protein n=1 Tax=Ferruginibacter sp. HRS2-29 TaxID=2487334 RepID=UPI0020CDDDDF|nr:hypothetical protein [Ferruginibacter sp. HRS2-29]MCP9749959.1 hypothetical protein [Ferruginibacter sp. HRS2-29]